MLLRSFILGFLAFSLSGCEYLAIKMTPKKQAITSHSELASLAQQRFWKVLHEGQYQNISDADLLLTAAYLQNPNDPKIAAHLGFLHIWKITERGREPTLRPTIVNEIILAKKYFNDAVELEPKDARYLGFLGDSQLVEGTIFNDKRLQTRGYFTLKDAIHAWPEFNYFTGGYVMSKKPSASERFREGLEWQWSTLELCAQHKINRANPDFSPFMTLETNHGPKRACWNSWIAPFNFEGFFLNMGDMLVKSGDPETAIKIYRNAKLARNYSNWPYRSLLEKHMANAKDNVQNFQKNTLGSPDKSILFNSGYGCVACHQQK
ncbi:MAG: hypothetical protein ACYCQI_11805 [Gammaproteobacteria bacterium]